MRVWVVEAREVYLSGRWGSWHPYWQDPPYKRRAEAERIAANMSMSYGMNGDIEFRAACYERKAAHHG